MRQSIITAFCILLFSSCTSNRQWLPSYTDPAFAGVSFRSIAALSDTGDLEWRKAFERTLTEEMLDEEAVCIEASALMPPTRSYTEVQLREILRERGIDAWLTVRAGRTESYEEIIPEIRETVKEKEPIVERVRYREKGKWVEKDSVTGTREIATTKTNPAHTVLHTRVQFHLELVDVISGRTAWIGDYTAVVDRPYMGDLCESIARQLIKDGIVRKK
jgi:hypothetical protein